MNIEKIKAFATKAKTKAAIVGSTVAVSALAAAPAFAEDSAELMDASASTSLVDISSAMNTAVSSAVGVMLSMMIGLIPVALQVLSAFLLFKFGKKFFAKVG